MTTNIVATIPKEQMRSLFYLLNGKPDSQLKIFDFPIQVNKNDIINLHSRIHTKLETHDVSASIISVRLGYNDSSFNEFGTWEGFASYQWETDARVQEINLKWDFFLEIKNYSAPQRHVLVVRMTNDFKPSNFFQVLTSSNKEDFEDIDFTMAPGFCRVDFINAQISKELLNEVSEWFKARKSPKLIPDIWYWCKKRRQAIAELSDHWVRFSFALLSISLLLFLHKKYQFGAVEIAAYTLASIYALMYPAKKFGHSVGQFIFSKLSSIEGSKVVFDITEGDKKAAAERYQENKSKGIKFAVFICINALINFAANITSIIGIFK